MQHVVRVDRRGSPAGRPGVAGRTCTRSPRILGLLAIEDALERASKCAPAYLRRVVAHHAVGGAHHLGPHRRAACRPSCARAPAAGRRARGSRAESNASATDGPTTITPWLARNMTRFVAERARQAVAFGVVDHQAVVGVVVGDVVVEAQRVLLDHLEPAALEQRERRRVRHVRVEHAGRARVGEVDARMDVERGLLVLALALQDPPVGVERKQVGGGDFAPVQPVAVEQEALAVGSMTLKWLQTPSCRSRRTASRKAAARSTRAACSARLSRPCSPWARL